MTNAGWYPDPAGQPQTYRYWDGQSWSEQTTGNPYDPAPGASGAPGGGAPFGQDATVVSGAQPPAGPGSPYPGSPTPPPGAPGSYGGGYGQPPYPPASSGSGGGSGKAILLAVVAVVLIALLGVGAFFGIRALGDDGDDGDDDAGGSETSSDTVSDTASGPTSGGTTDPSTPETSASGGSTDSVTPSTLHCSGGNPSAPTDAPADGQLHGGGLTVPNPRGYRVDDLGTATVFAFADSVQVTLRQIEEFWISLYAVGGLRKDNGFDSPEQAAELITQCMTGSEDFYSGFTGRTDLRNGPVTVDGSDGHEILTEVRVDDDRVQAEGDVLHVVVVDTGDDQHYGLYISMAPIGDQELIDRQASVLEQITVD